MNLTTDAAFALLRPPANDVLRFFEIGPAVNKAANDFAEVQRPVAAEPAPATQEPAAAGAAQSVLTRGAKLFCHSLFHRKATPENARKINRGIWGAKKCLAC